MGRDLPRGSRCASRSAHPPTFGGHPLAGLVGCRAKPAASSDDPLRETPACRALESKRGQLASWNSASRKGWGSPTANRLRRDAPQERTAEASEHRRSSTAAHRCEHPWSDEEHSVVRAGGTPARPARHDSQRRDSARPATVPASLAAPSAPSIPEGASGAGRGPHASRSRCCAP